VAQETFKGKQTKTQMTWWWMQCNSRE